MALRHPGRDVTRLFQTLVDVLAREAPDRLYRPIQVAELYQRIVPYRKYRRTLGIDQNDDYEMAVLRLLAGEGGYAVVEPSEARETLAAEAAAVHPEPTIVREFAGATLQLVREHVQAVLGDEQRFAPPGAADEPAAPPDDQGATPPFVLETETGDDAPLDVSPPPPPRPSDQVDRPTCRSCGRALPLHREVAFCPFCGQPPGERRCSQCGDEIEGRWRFCVTCGAPAAGGA